MKYELNFFSEYHQFYLESENNEGDTSAETFWSNQAFADKLAIEKGILGVGVENDESIVKGSIEILSKKSTITNFDNVSHVVEASIDLSSGKLLVTDCPSRNTELEVNISPGEYRVRVYSNKLETAYDENPQDYYQIEIWQEKYSDCFVLKRYLG
jgi:hypothetical protein